MNDSDAAPTATPPPLGGLDPEKLLAAALRSSPVTLPAYDWEPPSVETVNEWFPEYEVDRLIARGAMGAVYHAVHSRLGREVAIKLLPAALAQREEMAARFDREARALARLNHPNIVALHDFGRTAAGHPFIVMEYVSGTDLSRLIRGGELPVTLALEIIGQVCDALQYAHSQGFVHRDIKPGNILVDTGGRVRIADFGLTKLLGGETGPAAGRTLTGAVLGTPEYTAPEQLRGGTVDHRADIYSLGVMLYEMLTGDLPRGAWALPSQRAAADVRLDEVVTRAMQNEPDKRYQQASEVKTAINAPAIFSDGKSVPRYHGNAWLAVILFACAAWLAALVPLRHFYFTAQICGPLVLVGLWLLSRNRRPAAWHGLMAGLAVAAVMVATPYLRELVRRQMTDPPLSGKTAKPVTERVMEEKLAQSKDRTARILSGIDEALRAQQTKVKELESRLKSMRSDYSIADPPIENWNGATDSTSREKMEREMQDQLAIYEAKDRRLSGLSGAAAWELVPDDETIAFFHKQRKQDLATQTALRQSGYGAKHPRMLGLAYSIVKQEEILGKALKEYKAALKTNMANLRQSLARIQESKSNAPQAPALSPEQMQKYNDLKVRHDLAVETLQELKRSATQLTVGALSLFQQETDSLSRYVGPQSENGVDTPVLPLPVSPPATGAVDKPLSKAAAPPVKADES
ncbi:MAG: serine/threonine protein kinase, partial [Verrucomicrobiaceae bacterium]